MSDSPGPLMNESIFTVAGARTDRFDELCTDEAGYAGGKEREKGQSGRCRMP